MTDNTDQSEAKPSNSLPTRKGPEVADNIDQNEAMPGNPSPGRKDSEMTDNADQNNAKPGNSSSRRKDPEMTDNPDQKETEVEIATSAYEAFTVGKYDDCLKHLEALQGLKREEDYKIEMNKAIAEFYKSGQSTTLTLKQRLMTIKNQVRTMLAEGASGLGDMEKRFLNFNLAIIHYYTQQYSAAISIGKDLAQFTVDPLERFSQAVCFLLADLCLLTNQPKEAFYHLVPLENACRDESMAVMKTVKSEDERRVVLEPVKSKIHHYKMRAYIQFKSSKACKREIECVMNTAGNAAPSLFLKSYFEYLRGNYREAVKLLKSSNVAEYPVAATTGESIQCMFWNNLGCIHFAMRKHNLGMFYFKRALEENDHARAQLGASGGNGQSETFEGIPMCALVSNKRYELLYNCGIQLLHIGRPQPAFACLNAAVEVYPSNPRLWLRLAECCIATNQVATGQQNKGPPSNCTASQTTQNNASSEGQSAAVPVASMEFAAVCLRNALHLLSQHKETEAGNIFKGQSRSTEGGRSEYSNHPNGIDQEADKFLCAAPSSSLRLQEVENIRCSILACSAYVALALGDNHMALKHAEKLHQQPNVSGSLKFLSHLYAAEALISLDMISDAITHLNPENVTDVTLTSDQGWDKGGDSVESSGRGTPLCYPSSVSSARAMLLFNLGSAYSLRCEYEKARRCLHQAASMAEPKEIPPEAILLGAYVELQTGNTLQALRIIKQNQLLPKSPPHSFTEVWPVQ